MSLSAFTSTWGSNSTFSGLPVPTEVMCVPRVTHGARISGVVLAVAVTITRWSRTACSRDGVGATCVCTNGARSEEHTSELQSRVDLVCRLLLEKKKKA